MTILTPRDLEQLLENGKAQRTFEEQGHAFRLDFEPVVKLLSAWEWRAWTLAAIDPEEPDLAYGLFDGDDCVPQLGEIRLSHLEAYRDPLGGSLQRMNTFTPRMTLLEYAAHALSTGNTVLSP